jgi:hypothetical protein
MLDARRTPIQVVEVQPESGSFELEVLAFEDRGARWQLPVWDVSRFQFPPGAAVASELERLVEAARRFDRTLTVEAERGALESTLSAIAAERARALPLLEAHRGLDLDACVAERRGDPDLAETLHGFLAARDLAELDRQFTETFVSNPNSGELVKGHAIVLAHLGLHPYRGHAPRDRRLLTHPWPAEQRKRHIIARLGFLSALWTLLELDRLTLYRGAASEEPLSGRSDGSFVSATFSLEVAQSHFEGGPATRNALLMRMSVPASRVFMTFLETSAMNERFLEAEAVVIGDPVKEWP